MAAREIQVAEAMRIQPDVTSLNRVIACVRAKFHVSSRRAVSSCSARVHTKMETSCVDAAITWFLLVYRSLAPERFIGVVFGYNHFPNVVDFGIFVPSWFTTSAGTRALRG